MLARLRETGDNRLVESAQEECDEGDKAADESS
jgi:hypothetical protein